MKKLYTILAALFCIGAIYGQTPSLPVTNTNNLKIANPIEGALSDSVLVWRGTADKIIRWIPVSSIVTSVATPNLDAVLEAGSTGEVADTISMSSTAGAIQLKAALGVYNRGGGNLDSNTAFGQNAGIANTTGLSGTFVGREAGAANTTGNDNTFYGSYAGAANTTGSQNVFVGNGAGRVAVATTGNTFVGSTAGRQQITGNSNTAVGRDAARFLNGGQLNATLGEKSGYKLTTGSENTLIGRATGFDLTTGIRNTIIGPGFEGTAGVHGLETGSYNTYIGRVTGRTATEEYVTIIADGSNNALIERLGLPASNPVNIYGTGLNINGVAYDNNLLHKTGNETKTGNLDVTGRVSATNIGIGTTSPLAGTAIDAGGSTNLSGINAYVSFTSNANNIQALQLHNSSSGTSAEMRFIARANDDSYFAFTQPSSTNTGMFFGVAKNTGSFIFNSPSTLARDMYIGTLGSKSVNLATSGTVRFTIDAAGAINSTGSISGITPTSAAHLTRKDYVDTQVATKQATLVSGTNIKTVGGQSLLGSGNVTEVQNSMTASTTLAPSVTAANAALDLKAAKAGDTYTGTHNFTGATTNVATPTYPHSGSQAINGDYLSTAITNLELYKLRPVNTVLNNTDANFTGSVEYNQFVTHTGNTAALEDILPPIDPEYIGVTFWFFNKSTESVLISTATGGFDIIEENVTKVSYTLPVGEQVTMRMNGTYWVVVANGL